MSRSFCTSMPRLPKKRRRLISQRTKDALARSTKKLGGLRPGTIEIQEEAMGGQSHCVRYSMNLPNCQHMLQCGRPKRGHPRARRPSRCGVPTVKSPHSISVPKIMLATYDAVAALADTFCCDKLNDEYRDLARAMTAALCRKRPSPLASGQLGLTDEKRERQLLRHHAFSATSSGSSSIPRILQTTCRT